MPSLRALLRFWWLIVLGFVAAAVVLTLMVYRVDLGVPPKLEHRAQTYYVAATDLLVDSPTGPYLRGAVEEVVQPTRSATPPLPATPAKTGSSDAQAPTVTFSPDKKGLIDAANLFPLIIESDEVRTIREQQIGVVPGRVTASALYAIRGENRYRPSSLPVIQIKSAAGTPEAAVLLTQATTEAFGVWLATEQDRAKVPAAQRILVRELRAPTGAQPVGGPDYGLPLFAAIAVLSAFAGLAFVLDHSFPRRSPQAPALASNSEGSVGKSVDELMDLVDAALAQVAGETTSPSNGRRQAPVEGARLERAPGAEH
jgi:hypothetical protein